MNQAVSAQLLEELDLGSARGGKAGINKSPLEVTVVRALDESDLPAIKNPPPVGAAVQVVKSLRNSHHRLAELVAKGTAGAEISLITGFSQSYISNLHRDPAFSDLVSYYAEQNKIVYVDAMERLKGLGVDAIEKLHEKLNDEAQPWSPRELMEVVDLAIVKPSQVKGGSGQPGQAPGANLSLEVKFVGARPAGGPVVEAQFTEVKSDT